MANLSTFSTTAASNNSAAPDGFPEGMAPSDLNDSARELMAAVRRWYEEAEWIDRGHTPTFVDADTFTIPGDVTGIYEVNRRVRLTDSSTLYGTITASTFTSLTTIDVNLDSGSITGSLSAVAHGAASVTNSSITAATAGNGVLAGKDTIDSSSLIDAGVVASSDLATNVGHWVQLSSETVSTQSEVVVDTSTGSYTRHLIRIRQLAVTAANAALRLTISDDAGATYESTDYARAYLGRDTTGGDQSDSGTGGAFLSLTPVDIDGASSGRFDCDIILVNAQGSTTYKNMFVQAIYPGLASGFVSIDGTGLFNGNTNGIDRVKIVPSTSTLASGTVTLFGLVNE